MINKMKIDEAFEFYNIDKSYKEECYRCIEEINRSENYKKVFKDVYEILYCSDFFRIKELWQIKDVNELFVNNHKKRIKECFQNDLIYRKYNGVRISQMLWAVYFIRVRIFNKNVKKL